MHLPMNEITIWKQCAGKLALHSIFFARYLTRLYSSVIRQIGIRQDVPAFRELSYLSQLQCNENAHLNFSRKYSCISNKCHEGIKFSFEKTRPKPDNTACFFPA